MSALPGFGQQPPTINVAGNHWGGTILLGVTVPLYDGGARRALEGQARNEAARSDAALERVRDEATREVGRGGQQSEDQPGRPWMHRKRSPPHRRSRSMPALEAYHHGVGSITDVTRAETALLEAQNISSDAYSAALTSAATLALSAGTLGASPE